VHSPLRYAWDMQHEYLREAGMARGLKSLLTRWLLHRLRLWDVRTANGVDQFVANSAFIARRVRKAYRREAEVIYPPVDLSAFIPTSCSSVSRTWPPIWRNWKRPRIAMNAVRAPLHVARINVSACRIICRVKIVSSIPARRPVPVVAASCT
jgi:glycosyltransferase involved in cell wall biosynthesis